jgi:hypothetical protein
MFLVRDLGLPPAIVSVSIGAFLGTLLAERFTRRFGVGRTIIGSLIIIPLWSGLLLLPLTTWSVSMRIWGAKILRGVWDQEHDQLPGNADDQCQHDTDPVSREVSLISLERKRRLHFSSSRII